MSQGTVSIFFGEGKGKTTASVGQAIRSASLGKTVVIIQFLKGKNVEELNLIQRMEPEIKWFTFEKSDNFFEELTEEQKQEEISNIRNGLNFAKKVLATREADVLILDEVLGLLDNNLITADDIRNLKEVMSETTELILTGRCCNEELLTMADEVSRIEKIK